jgi:hypothetical protein
MLLTISRISFVASSNERRLAVRSSELPIKEQTVAYCETKSTGTTGTSVRRTRHSARPPVASEQLSPPPF